jgi:hypothetical protein
MRTFVFDTGALPRALNAKTIYWVEDGRPRSKVLLVSEPAPIGATLTEHDDGTQESEIREAIQAASFADDWTLAYEIVQRYGLSACLRCGVDVSQRPTWRAHRLGIEKNWGEICGSCAVIMIAERG